MQNQKKDVVKTGRNGADKHAQSNDEAKGSGLNSETVSQLPTHRDNNISDISVPKIINIPNGKHTEISESQ